MEKYSSLTEPHILGALAVIAVALLVAVLRRRRRARSSGGGSVTDRLLGSFCQLCLLTGCLAWGGLMAVGLLMVVAQFPWLLGLVGLVVVYRLRHGLSAFGAWAFGTSRWAKSSELAAAGLLGSKSGLLVGKVEAPAAIHAAKLLLHSPSLETCALFLQSLCRRGAWVRLNRGTHSVCFAPSGRGKGAGLVIPNLLTYPGSVVVIDPKGENARASAAWRRRALGHRIVILDPFGQLADCPELR